MADNNNIQWKRISAEGAAIVASILLAFAIDARWDSEQADTNTQEIQGAVRLEMAANLPSLQDSVEHHVAIVEAVRLAQDQMSINGLLDTAVIDVEVFEPSTGALDTLAATGMLADIDNSVLQTSLGALTGYARDLNVREIRAVKFRDAARRRIA